MSLSPVAQRIEEARRSYAFNPHRTFEMLMPLAGTELMDALAEIVGILIADGADDAQHALAKTAWLAIDLREHWFNGREYDEATRDIIADIVVMFEKAYQDMDEVRLHLEVNNAWDKAHLVLVVLIVIQQATLSVAKDRRRGPAGSLTA